jgi:hypothetical protein
MGYLVRLKLDGSFHEDHATLLLKSILQMKDAEANMP